ncbi:hypothetical protein BL253_35510 [Pseudofrankia asymbiotica]|uniref:Uncharacterized protein n=1 Tax=Pseudofrankia asymbiotica TaxID=1834516 RepID=A0A1V2I0A8_9ACTN|nr:hypothetical protein BL253_35510 [Pseudofrankia asymbiotica]
MGNGKTGTLGEREAAGERETYARPAGPRGAPAEQIGELMPWASIGKAWVLRLSRPRPPAYR